MAFQEYTAQLPVGPKNHRETMSFDIDVDVDTHEVTDIYTHRSNYDDMPTALKNLEWTAEKNALHVHVAARHQKTAWTYLRQHAFLDEELEALLAG